MPDHINLCVCKILSTLFVYIFPSRRWKALLRCSIHYLKTLTLIKSRYRRWINLIENSLLLHVSHVRRVLFGSRFRLQSVRAIRAYTLPFDNCAPPVWYLIGRLLSLEQVAATWVDRNHGYSARYWSLNLHLSHHPLERLGWDNLLVGFKLVTRR